ncbi:glycosyltransferase 61 family protein [Paracoccus beibuensis]|uniref:glycosyltransferase 61 family protein n=1 Tax=Paracoccus beibuensis TaxID=547602 RepID=UPI0022409D62|nr:glycosyltransferase 61 family protein [Paracoccus beibuensis]
MPAPDEITPLAGKWMFGGVLYGHFGHFITESFARAWALDEIRGQIEGVLFTPKQTSGNIDNMLKALRPLMDILGLDVPVRCIMTPTRVEQLYVPRQGVGMSDLTVGSQKFRNFVNAHSGAAIAPEGDERIYISRSLLPPGRGGLVGESLLEQYLADEGYQLFHPQKHPAAVQVARYKAARDIITVDCSPLHMLAYVGNSEQRVGILTRRSMDFAPSFIRQLEAFKGITAFEVNTLVRDWVPGRSLRPGRGSFGEMDVPRTWQILRERGMISSDTPWPALTDAQREADLSRLNALHGLDFHPLDENLALQEKRTAKKAV